MIQAIDPRAMVKLKKCKQRGELTWQQYKTLKGQILAGNGEAAMKGLKKILDRQNHSRCARAQ